MASTPKTFNLHLCFLTINGVRIEGFGEDDVITFEEASDDVTPTTGADGQKTYSVTNDRSYKVTLTVMENSLGCQQLRAQQREQEAERASGGILRRPFQFLDQVSGSRVSDDYCVFLNTPGPNKGKLIKSVQFMVDLPNGKEGMQLAPSVST